MSKKSPSNSRSDFNLQTLADSIHAIHAELSQQVSKAVNISLTMRNWLIGFYISEYELNGADRAEYGKKTLTILSDLLSAKGVVRSDVRELRRYRQFYEAYPQIRESLTPEFLKLLPPNDLGKNGSKRESLTPKLATPPSTLISTVSYTHIVELLTCDTVEKRVFYETQCIAGGWSVRELKRQINSFLFERSELSTDKQKLTEQANENVEQQTTSLTIRDPYVFEFLNLKAAEVMSESHLEDQLLNNLQQFLIELGKGFCFEARQKRILIGDTHNFVDLVFYHRILKCHVLVELKLEEFSHENIGQINTYVSWYNKNVREKDDGPTIGILLCTEKDHALAEYALAGMDNDLFVSKYQLVLPSKEELQRQINLERRRLENE